MAPSEANHPLLSVRGAETGYGKKQVLSGIDIEVRHGEALALLGHNGAGKTTLLQSIFGILPIWSGEISIDGSKLPMGHSFADAVKRGLAMIPSERFVFPELSVLDNLRISARGLSRTEREERFEASFHDFPILKERSSQRAGSMSGGQQRMVSLAMALMNRPKLLLLDEPLLGLSPALAEQFMQRVAGLVRDGMSVLLVEQNIAAALLLADRISIMRSGKIILSEPSSEFAKRSREEWWTLF